MTFKHHLVAIPAPSWGHQRPILPVLFKVAQERPDILVTIPVIGQFKGKMDKELARYCVGSNHLLKDHIRIVQLSDFDGVEVQYWVLIIQLWPDFFEKLWASESVSCYSGQTYPRAPKPELCIIDSVLLDQPGTSMLQRRKVKILCWNPGSPFSFLSLAAPPEYGGLGDVVHEAHKLAEETNIPILEARIKFLFGTSGKVRNIAGLPPAYDYEFLGDYILPGVQEMVAMRAEESSKLLKGCHGSILASSPIIDGGGIEAFKRWTNSMGQSCYTLGPGILPEEEVNFNEEESSRGQEVLSFLEKIYKTHGRYSLLYMSFGTSVFPSGDTAFQLVDIMRDMEVPLILAMAHGDTFHSMLPDDLRDRLESSELALAVKWAPQRAILNHPVTGGFLTHGGQGSLTESLVAGVPMIVWPIQGLPVDQPCNAMNLTLNLKVAYQLLEVRIGHGLKPLYRGCQPKGAKEAIDMEFRQVLRDLFGADGEVKRKIAQDLSKRLKQTWKEGGEALTELRRFLQENFP